MDFFEMIKKEKEKNLERKKYEDENKEKNGQSVFNRLQWTGINKNEKVVRILGKPTFGDKREKSTDSKIILSSYIVNDDFKKYIHINWPYIVEGCDDRGYPLIKPKPNFILTELYNKVMEREWVNYTREHIDGKDVKEENSKIINIETKKTGFWNYFHSDKECYKRIRGNRRSSASAKEFPKNFYPQRRVIINVIDRHDDWCFANKHSKLLSSSVNEYSFIDKNTQEKVTIFYIDIGIPGMCYDNMLDHFLEQRGGPDDWATKDVIIKKIPKNYRITDATDDKHITEDSYKIAKLGGLTDEESKYELYDLDEEFKITNNLYIQKNLAGLIENVDGELGTSFGQKLNMLVNQECGNKTVSYPTPEKKVEESAEKKEVDKKVEDKKEEVDNKPQQEESGKEKSIEELCLQNFPSWNKVPDDQKSSIINKIEKFDGVVPIWKGNATPLGCVDRECKFMDGKTKTKYPDTADTCPVCGTVDPSSKK